MVAPKKSLGQHWLNDQASLEAMLASAEVGRGDTVLEIGPGLGSLTDKLLAVAGKVIAVEKDETLATKLLEKHLSKVRPSTDTEVRIGEKALSKVRPRAGRGEQIVGNLKVIPGDILRFDFNGLPAGYKLVANIPYYLTSNLIRVLSETGNPPRLAALLVQKEVAQRLAAEPGDMSILAVTAQFYWEVNLGREVRAELFEPPPKIDSQIVKLVRRRQKLFDVDEKQFFKLVRAGFSSKRKTLTNNLAAGYHLSKSEAVTILESAGIDPSARAQTLALADWHNLYINLLKQ